MVMKWSDSRIGRFIDDKVNEFKYPNTVLLVCKWADLSAMQRVLNTNGSDYIWIGQSPSPYAEHNAVATFFIPIHTRLEGDKILAVFKHTPNFSYARFYNGTTAIKALRKTSV